MAERSDIDGRPAKRARLDPATESAALTPTTAATTSTELPKAPIDSGPTAADGDLEREVRAGITEYVCPDNLGFTGVLKHRYTDFLVNEIGLDGKVLHLRLAGVEKRDEENVVVNKEVVNSNQSDKKPETQQEQKVEVKTEDATAEAPPKQDVIAEAETKGVDAAAKANDHEDTEMAKPEDQQVRGSFSAAFALTHKFDSFPKKTSRPSTQYLAKLRRRKSSRSFMPYGKKKTGRQKTSKPSSHRPLSTRRFGPKPTNVCAVYFQTCSRAPWRQTSRFG